MNVLVMRDESGTINSVEEFTGITVQDALAVDFMMGRSQIQRAYFETEDERVELLDKFYHTYDEENGGSMKNTIIEIETHRNMYDKVLSGHRVCRRMKPKT